MRLTFCARVWLAIACASVAVHPQDSNVRVKPLPRSLEVHLALSAAPPHLRSGVTVFVLDPANGYVPERKGTNGFTCYVQRTDYVREVYGDDYFAPECQDAEGTKSIVPVEFDIERLRAEGKLNATQLKQEIVRRFKEAFTTHRLARESLTCCVLLSDCIKDPDPRKPRQ